MPGGVSVLLVEKIRLAGLMLMAVTALKLAGESVVFLSLRNKKQSDLKRSALLLRIDEDFVSAHCDEFDGFAAHVRDYAPSVVAERTGIPEAQIESLAKTIHEGKRVSFWWTMGVNQSHEGVRTAQAIIDLALMTGNIGRPGTGANSITGQCNAMGSRLFSNTTNLLGGHAFENPAHREKVANVLDIDVEAIPQEGSWAYDDFLVVQDMYHSTDTADFADLVLPAHPSPCPKPLTTASR